MNWRDEKLIYLRENVFLLIAKDIILISKFHLVFS